MRTGGRPPDDPDTSRRWLRPEKHERPRAFVAERFPGLADAPVSETRACHYELSATPVIGEYLAGRVLGTETDLELTEAFRLTDEEFD